MDWNELEVDGRVTALRRGLSAGVATDGRAFTCDLHGPNPTPVAYDGIVLDSFGVVGASAGAEAWLTGRGADGRLTLFGTRPELAGTAERVGRTPARRDRRDVGGAGARRPRGTRARLGPAGRHLAAARLPPRRRDRRRGGPGPRLRARLRARHQPGVLLPREGPARRRRPDRGRIRTGARRLDPRRPARATDPGTRRGVAPGAPVTDPDRADLGRRRARLHPDLGRRPGGGTTRRLGGAPAAVPRPGPLGGGRDAAPRARSGDARARRWAVAGARRGDPRRPAPLRRGHDARQPALLVRRQRVDGAPRPGRPAPRRVPRRGAVHLLVGASIWSVEDPTGG